MEFVRVRPNFDETPFQFHLNEGEEEEDAGARSLSATTAFHCKERNVRNVRPFHKRFVYGFR